MRLFIASTALLLAGAASAATSWTFSDGTVVVAPKNGGGVSQKFTDKQPAKNVIELPVDQAIKVSLVTKEGSKAKRPHQAFLVITEATGLEAPFPLTVKDSGKGSVEITQKDLPVQLLKSEQTLRAKLVLGSFGSATASVTPAFDIDVKPDPNAADVEYASPMRYGKQSEIHHIFRGDPKSPPKIISAFFTLCVLATVPVLFVAWLTLGANVSHISKAMSSAPISHALFFGSVAAIEGVFFLYYSSWNLFQTLPVICVVGLTAFLSGSRALSEVRSRRLAGER